MKSENYNVLGVMSGTSLDGIDLAHVTLSVTDNKWSYAIHEAETVPYPDEWVVRLKEAVNYDEDALFALDDDYTIFLAGVISSFLVKHSLHTLDGVCSHGHTVLHQPKKGITLQIGNKPALAKLTGLKVICNFRIQDVQMGGQGAPLVPVGDRLLFSDYDFCLNLGGFSNISFEDNGNRIAYDISPVNTVLNFYANRLGLPYDNGGTIARSGSVVPSLLDALNGLDYYKKSYPKSLGFEYVRDVVLPLMEDSNAAIPEKLRTFTTHVAMQLAREILRIKPEGKLLITGGGAYNNFLIAQLKAMLPDVAIVIPDDKTIQFKEALIFALLGVLKLRGEINVLASVTGAPNNHCSGYIFEP